jgi:hypothetical protein
MSHSANYVAARQTYWKLALAYDFICPVITRSHDTFFDLWAKPIRVVFIDSGHLYHRTRMEIQAALIHMVEDGWMVFHDYAGNEWGEGVIPTVNQFLDEDRRWVKAAYRAGSSLVLVHLEAKAVY